MSREENALVRNRSYLDHHRRTIIGRSLAASFAGALPIPVLDEWLASTIRRSTIRRIAQAHHIDMDDDAVAAIADGPETPPKLSDYIGTRFALRLLAKQWKKLIVAVVAAKRAQVAGRNFEVATCFDHYCARVHVGLGLNKASGQAVRELIDTACAETKGGMSRQLFRRGLIAAAKTSAKAPLSLMDTLSGGRLKKLLKGKDEIAATSDVNEVIESQLRSEDSFLARSAAAIELQLAVEQNPYLENLLGNFERLCQESD